MKNMNLYKKILKMHIVYPRTLEADQKIHTLSKISYPAFQPTSFLANQQNQLLQKKADQAFQLISFLGNQQNRQILQKRADQATYL